MLDGGKEERSIAFHMNPSVLPIHGGHCSVKWLLVLVLGQCLLTSGLARNAFLVRMARSQRSAGNTNQCSHIRNDIAPEQTHELADLLKRWRNQCAYNSAYSALWFPQGASSGTGHLPMDAKCCDAPVDSTLTDSILDLHNIDKGTSDVTKTWNVECPANSIITAIRISTNDVNGYRGHLSGIKCALLVNYVIDYGKCHRIDLLSASGGSRDPRKTWQGECPPNTRLMGLYDDNGFTTVKFGKCCEFRYQNIVSSLPWSCSFKGSSCGWKNRSDLKLKWKIEDESGGQMTFLALTSGKGKGQLLSPGMPPIKGSICLRLKYFLKGLVILKVLKKAYVPDMHFTNVSSVISITSPQERSYVQDVVLKSRTTFQIILEGVRISTRGSINIFGIGFGNLSDCAADMCRPPSKGCEQNEACRPVRGNLRCVCKPGFQIIQGRCQGTAPSQSPGGTTAIPTTVSGGEGNRGGGGGKKDGGDGEKGPDGKPVGKKVLNNGKNLWGSWVYTAIGATAGIFLVLIFVFGFMMYRRKLNDRNRQHSFVMEMRSRRYLHFNPMVAANANAANDIGIEGAHVQLSSENVYVENPPRNRIDSIWSNNTSNPEQKLDTESSASGSPNSHHYHELEPDDAILGARRVSQFTLVKPIYGSSEDIAEANGNMFSEPPFDEEELLSKLGREISYHAITLKEEIGHGAFGFVKLGYWDKHNNERIKVAVKMLKEPTTMKDRVKFLQEAAIMRQFDHTNVVRMYGIVTRFCSPMIVLEYMSNKNLKKYLYRLRRTRERANLEGVDYELHRLFLRMAREIVAGMCYLHSLKFVHRDIAARNILLDSNLVCKIGDFGLARDLIDCEYYESGGGAIPVRWTAPEAINYKRYSSASDTWSFGITLHEIWSLGRKPYAAWDNNTVIDKVDQGFRLPPPQNCPRVIYHLMIDCWHPEESKRPTFSQIRYCLSHHDDRLIGRLPRMDRIRSVTCNDIIDNQEQGLYDDLQYIYCKTE